MQIAHWTAGLHHDGSVLFVSNPSPKLNEVIKIRLRAPLYAPIRAVLLRTAPDGEQHFEPLRRERQDSICVWWGGEVRVTMPLMAYRFRVMSDEGAFWLTQLGVSRADSPDMVDFKLVADFAAPSWVVDSVFYQIFPDRFYNGDPSNDVPSGAWTRGKFKTQQREWGAPPLPYKQGGTLDFYGGDLPGITQKLDYLVDLGVNALFLNPIFTAYTNHRYDVADYHHVDPYLGGDDALVELRRAMDRVGMRLILDVTPNHCGDRNLWFKAAQADRNAPSAEYFTFNKHPDDYESWLGHKSLVKLNYRSEKLREAMYRSPDSVMRHWLHEPYRIDGWRLDVANMTARQGAVQLNHKVWRGIRRAVKADSPQAFLFGENFYDGTPHLQGNELDATMNYQGFTLPLWDWLRTPDVPPEIFEQMPAFDPVRLPAEALAEHWTRFKAVIPWVVTRQQFNQLDSHDTPRISWITGGDKALVKLGAALMMTFPGVPSVYYGDEIGMTGGNDPDNRRCMVWQESEWDTDLRAYYQRLIRMRRTAPALIHGGFQLVYAHDGLIAYLRQSTEQRLLIIGYRGVDVLDEVSLPVWHAGIADGVNLTDRLGSTVVRVENGAIRLSNLERGAALILEG